jgi:fatty-acyl-CoA synthase
MHITDLFDLGARHYPKRLVFTGAGGNFTYAEAQRMTNQIARKLNEAGIGRGSRFAVLSPNCGQAMLAMLGGMRASAVWCNVNLRNALPNNIDILKRGGCHVLFFHSSVTDAVPAIQAAVDTLQLAICLDGASDHGPHLMDFVADQSGEPLWQQIPDDDIGFQGATGGTTGLPKLALGTHQWLAMSTIGWATCWRFDIPPVNLAVAPITHAAGVIALAHLPFGGTTVMMQTTDLDSILGAIAQHRVTTLFLPPTLIYMLLAHPKVRHYDYSSLRYFISAAAPMAPEKMAEAIDVFGPVMCQAFGQTEAGFPLTFMSPPEVAEAVTDESKRHRLLSCRRQLVIVAGMEIMDDGGRLLSAHEVGEIVLRGPTEMQRYLNDPQATQEIKQYDWHHTGDIGYRDEDGYFYITDRKRDLIISGGFNIFPFEIERVLLEHPAVQDCAVIGVPDAKWGEAVKAIVQLAPRAEVSQEDLLTLCRNRLGGVKTPKSLEFWEDLPRSAVGKVLKREIRKAYWADKDRSIG